jgi:hypothetical protein
MAFVRGADELMAAVEAAFAVTGRGLARWANPRDVGEPAEDEYSRVTDAAKWRIVGARAEAWFTALEAEGLARIERDALVEWVEEPRVRTSRTDRAVPTRGGAIPLVVARSQIGDVPDAGVAIGVGDPAVCVQWLPDCGCDACDSGSQNELDFLDEILLGIVAGTFRRLKRPGCTITQFHPDGWSASCSSGRFDARAALADPTGWDELSGGSWLRF